MDSLAPFRITRAGFMSDSAGFGTHSHADEHEFHYLPRAQCTIKNGGRWVYLPDHSLIYSEPEASHGIIASNEKNPLAWYFFRFRLDTDNLAVMERLRSTFAGCGRVRLGPAFETRCRNMLTHLQSSDPLLRTSGAFLFAAFIYEIAWNCQQQSSMCAGSQVDALIGWMHQNLSNALRLDMAAKTLGIDKSYLIRLFKKKTGASPVRFFNGLKADAAAELLTTTSLSVREIAERLGFCDPFYFSRLFRQHTGLPPLAYRRSPRLRTDH